MLFVLNEAAQSALLIEAMELFADVIAPIIIAAVFAAGWKTGLLSILSKRPLATLIVATIGAEVYRRTGGVAPNPEFVRDFARFGLAMLAFAAAQQCRLSRFSTVSPAAQRIVLFSTPLILALFSAIAFILVPGLELWGTLIVGIALMLGGAPHVERPLLNAPIEQSTKCAARIEGAMALTIGLPIALIVEAGLAPTSVLTPIHEQPLFVMLSSFAVGGTVGLLAGRFLPLSKATLPVLPFVIAIGTFFGAQFIGFDPLMTVAAAGILYSEEARMKGSVRTTFWRTSERILSPFAFAGLGFVLGPMVLQVDFLVWVMAILTVGVIRIIARLLVLQGGELAEQDRQFLAWSGGAPGAGSAFFLLALLASPAVVVYEQPVGLATATLTVGLIFTRLGSRPLTMRLVQETARARKRRYSPA